MEELGATSEHQVLGKRGPGGIGQVAGPLGSVLGCCPDAPGLPSG